MGELEESVQRHPAGKAQKENIWDVAWAVSKAMELGAQQEQERIIKLLEDERFAKAFGRSKDFNAKRANLIALIKGENK